MDLGRAFKLLEAPSTAQRLAHLRVRADLLEAAAAMVADSRSDPAVAALQNYLAEFELVRALAQGCFRRRLGLLALTDQRIIFAGKHAPPLEIDIELAAVDRTEIRLQRYSGSLHLLTKDAAFEITKLLGKEGVRFNNSIHQQLTDPASACSPDPLITLAELRDQRNAGTISAEQFEAAKVQLMRQI